MSIQCSPTAAPVPAAEAAAKYTDKEMINKCAVEMHKYFIYIYIYMYICIVLFLVNNIQQRSTVAMTIYCCIFFFWTDRSKSKKECTRIKFFV